MICNLFIYLVFWLSVFDIYATIVLKIDIFSDLVTRKSKWRQMTSLWLQNGITSNIKKVDIICHFCSFFERSILTKFQVYGLHTYKSWYNNFNFVKVWFKLDFLRGGLGLGDLSQHLTNVLSWNFGVYGKRDPS